MTFPEFFQAATGKPPYDYQGRLAEASACQSRLISIPTGLGKTAAVILAWLWNRVAHPDGEQRETWPRRLVYCLPMRTLVEQTKDEAQKWIDALFDAKRITAKPRIVVLMGGEPLEPEARDWDIHPEADTILIGTQDMLLSRALNRGYGMSRYRWPMHFGLLNNDCLWVMDETQLMGVGVETSAQLDGFRHNEKMPVFGRCPTWWMSATLEEKRLDTVDHRKPASTERLSEIERSSGRPHELITAPKKLSPVLFALSPGTKDYARQLAKLVKERHQPGTLTLVIVNRVKRAREIYEALTTVEKKSKQPLYDPKKVALIHSRFRPIDRERHMKLLSGEGDRIVIATQAVEAGVDISGRLLITELAPWSSLVQRMGRCNRRAEIADAEVLWVDIQPKDEKDELSWPYAKDELDKARAALLPLTDASPVSLENTNVPETPIIRPIIRRRDLVDLFDTTPDICGQDLDISRYIRDGEDNDVQFFWRDVAKDATPTRDDKRPQRIELCRVSIGDAVKFLNKETTRAWRWNPLEQNWEAVRKAHPGGVYFLATFSGGYCDDLGWTGDPKDKPKPHPPEDGAPEAYGDEPDTFSRSWQTIAEHTQLVVEQMTVLAKLVSEAAFAEALHTAALWHDVGKAHEEFQKALRDGQHQPPDLKGLYAKSENPPKRYSADRPYRSIRHELASALAWLLSAPPDTPERDLVAYLIAAHHGKVRLSIRSLPDEMGDKKNPDRLFARGIWQDEELKAVPLGEITTPAIRLDLSFMQMGEGQHGPSWLARAVALRDQLGPFRLAYLETLLRAADARASQQ